MRLEQPWLVVALLGLSLAAGAVALWLFVFNGDEQPADVAVFEGDALIATTTEGEAIKLIEEHAGFRPAVPGWLPAGERRLMTARVFVSPEDEEQLRSQLWFGPPVAASEEIVIATQGPEFWGRPLDEARALDIEVEGAEAWALPPEHVPGNTFWLRADGIWIHVMSGPALSDEDAARLLASFAEAVS